MLRNRSLVLLGFLCLLSGCVFPWQHHRIRVSKAMPPHEVWCYRTLGEIDCYSAPQDFPPDTLVSVDPPSKTPMTLDDYAKALAASRQ